MLRRHQHNAGHMKEVTRAKCQEDKKTCKTRETTGRGHMNGEDTCRKLQPSQEFVHKYAPFAKQGGKEVCWAILWPFDAILWPFDTETEMIQKIPNSFWRDSGKPSKRSRTASTEEDAFITMIVHSTRMCSPSPADTLRQVSPSARPSIPPCPTPFLPSVAPSMSSPWAGSLWYSTGVSHSAGGAR